MSQASPTSATDVIQEVPCASQEKLQKAVEMAQGGDPDAATELLRVVDCAETPALGAAYSAVIDAYLRQDRPDAASVLAVELFQKGSILPLPSQEAILRALVQGQQHSRTVEFLRAACAAGAVPGEMIFNSAVDGAVRARAYSEAWDILELLLASRRRADKYFVSILTKSLESSSDRRWVRRGIALVDRFILQQKEDVDEIVFNSLLNVLGQIGDMPKLQQTLAKMSEYGVAPSAVTYGTVVKAYGRSRDIDSVLKVWSEMRTRCLGVNPVTCGCVLDACVKCGHLDKAMSIFQEMRMHGLHKNTVLYATLIKGLAKIRDLSSAIQLYQEMRMEGVPCNLVTFNSLMDVCVRCSDLQTAALFLQDMMQMGIDPDLITFSTLIKGYSHIGEVHKALTLKNELKTRGLKCDEIMYNSLIDGCAKAGQIQDGLQVFQDMLQSHVPPSNITFSILVKLHFEAGQVAEAFRLVEDMAGRYRCAPSKIVYTVLFRCCAQHGGVALARGVALLGELAGRRGAKLVDQGMVSATISGCIRHGDIDTAIALVRDFTSASGRRSSLGTANGAGTANAAGGGMVQLECLRTVMQALGGASIERGQELLEYLRKKIPSREFAQLQTAFQEGQQCSGVSGCPPQTPMVSAGNTSTAHVAGNTEGIGGDVFYDPYRQWQGQQFGSTSPAAYAATMQQYGLGADYFGATFPPSYSAPQLGYYPGSVLPPPYTGAYAADGEAATQFLAAAAASVQAAALAAAAQASAAPSPPLLSSSPVGGTVATGVLQDPAITAPPTAAATPAVSLPPADLMPKALPLAQININKENQRPEGDALLQITTSKKANALQQQPQKKRSTKENCENANSGNTPKEQQVQKNNARRKGGQAQRPLTVALA